MNERISADTFRTATVQSTSLTVFEKAERNFDCARESHYFVYTVVVTNLITYYLITFGFFVLGVSSIFSIIGKQCFFFCKYAFNFE